VLPELFRIPFIDLPVHTYGALYVTALLVGLSVAYRQALLGKKYHNDVLDFGFWVLLGALLGARVLFIIVESNYYFVAQPFTKLPGLDISIPTIFALWKGGFVFWGGFIGGIVALIVFCRARNINIPQFADYFALGLPVGHAIGRIGCVAGGCCYGKAAYHLDHAGHVVADVPFALAFPPGSIAYGTLYNNAAGETLELMNKLGTTLPLLPIQLIEALGNLAIFWILVMMTPLKRVHGQIALSYMIFYSILRSVAELYRGDKERGFAVEGLLSTSQFISIVMILVSFALIVILYRNANKKINLAG
jgi:phosphatidylglycerol:prolipoprotein diacylglycerol transferase